jgi:tRNA A-37 threonylcarbamoyl transferase component Bud32
MTWPTPQDYNEAIQNPRQNFSDPELQDGRVALNSLGLPRAMTGAFASVYKMRCRGRDVAVRCFLHNLEDQRDRYAHLTQYIMSDDLIYTVSFEYIERGIRVKGRWYPILKMDWVDGVSLESYVKTNFRQSNRLQHLIERFQVMCKELKRAGIAHGDLQHGNIMILDDELRLVDYDGMFVPALTGWESNELGHRNYQHPERDPTQFNAGLDNFSAWSIFTSLQCLTLDPNLLTRLSGCDECLLFRQPDYKYPLSSTAFSVLESHKEEGIRQHARKFRSLLDRPLSAIPSLDEELPEPQDLAELATVATSFYLPSSIYMPERNFGISSVLATYQPPDPDAYSQWPKLVDYLKALSAPSQCFADKELASATVATRRGSLAPVVGTQSVVFKMQLDDRDIAVKCFTTPDTTREFRYKSTQAYFESILKDPLQGEDATKLLGHTTPFKYINEGIKVGTKWYPIVVMDWISGTTLDEYVEANRYRRSAMTELNKQLCEVMQAFQRLGIAHGDLNPSNFIVQHHRLILIDYDGMYVKALAGLQWQAPSHEHFRHPRHNAQFGPWMDNFPAWTIYVSLLALSIQPELWNKLGARNGRLLFRSSDFREPHNSVMFNILANHYRHDMRDAGTFIKRLLQTQIEEIPYLSPGGIRASYNPSLSQSGSSAMSSVKSRTTTIPGGVIWVIAVIGFLSVAGGPSFWILGIIFAIVFFALTNKAKKGP